jgi:putative SOS response-associated peptidase YedK
MCGRFTYKLTWAEIVKLYRLTLDQPARNTQPHYNICPTTTIDTIVSSEGKRALVPMRWGLIPYWWNKVDRNCGAKCTSFRSGPRSCNA